MGEETQDTQALLKTTVFFDGSCPLCAAEIDIYRRQDARGVLDLVDVTGLDVRLPAGLARDHAIKRFHVMSKDGRILSGAMAFVELWKQLPGWRWVGKIAGAPGINNLMEFAYRTFLHLRPALVRVFLFTRRIRSSNAK